jgi:hypothetical protein
MEPKNGDPLEFKGTPPPKMGQFDPGTVGTGGGATGAGFEAAGAGLGLLLLLLPPQATIKVRKLAVARLRSHNHEVEFFIVPPVKSQCWRRY